MSETRVCVVTGSRAEYGLLQAVMSELQADRAFCLQIVVTGMHLSPEFGCTYREVEADGFAIAAKVESVLSSDTSVGTAKSLGLGCIGFADTYQRLRPDVVMALGDRYEIFAAVQTAFIMHIPVVHIAGGDITEGAFDDAFRHSMTKMASLHFVTNEASRKRVVQLGEDPATVFNVGHTGIDRIQALPVLTREEVERKLNLKLREHNVLVTYHPVTRGMLSPHVEFSEVLDALAQLPQTTGIIFTQSNADPNGRRLIKMMDDFTARHENAVSYISLGQLYYFNLIRYVDAIIGNSSSGLCEVPSLKKPSVDIGDRQKGRMRGDSVIHCEPKSEEILEAIVKASHMDCTNVRNPYGNGSSSPSIIRLLKEKLATGLTLQKKFYEGDC